MTNGATKQSATTIEQLSNGIESLISALGHLRETPHIEAPQVFERAVDVCLATRRSWNAYLDHWRMTGQCPDDATDTIRRAIQDAFDQVSSLAARTSDSTLRDYLNKYVHSIALRRSMLTLLLDSGLAAVNEEYARRIVD